MSRDSVAVLHHLGILEGMRAFSFFCDEADAALDFAIAAIQSQQGATGGAGVWVTKEYAARMDADGNSAWKLVMATVKEVAAPQFDAATGTNIDRVLSVIRALAHPQAAGSAPGEAQRRETADLCAERHGWITSPSAGSAPVGVEGLLDALARLCDEWEAEAKQRNGQAGRLALRRCAMAVREHIRTTAAAPAVSVGDAKRSTSQSVAFQYLDQVVERQTAAFYSAFGIGTTDKIESDATLEKERAE